MEGGGRASCRFAHHLSCYRVKVKLQSVEHPPGVAAPTHATAVAEEQQQGEQYQRPPGKNTQQHQKQHIIFHLARRQRRILVAKKKQAQKWQITKGSCKKK